MTTTPPNQPTGGLSQSPPAPMSVILLLSFLCSIGTGVVTNGVYFLTSDTYHFSPRENYLLGLLQGITYIVAAMGTGPVIRRLRRRGHLSTRGLLTGAIAGMGLLCFIPIAARWVEGAAAAPPKWALWVMVGCYIPLTGILWPVIEAYLSGGRSGDRLRKSLGTWNICWSAALVVGLWLIGPLLGSSSHRGLMSAPQLIAALGILHLGTLAVVAMLGREPGIHVHEHHQPHPPVYTKLLRIFQILLPTSYLVHTAMAPYLPHVLKGLGVLKEWAAPAVSVWAISRVVSFFLMERWQGWHGKFSLAVISITLLLGGFSCVVLAPVLLTSSIALVATLIGLATFGTGIATTYTAALYYAMEVGQSEVEAGGTHESLIGLGYACGPLCGLAASAFMTPGDENHRFEFTVVLIVGAIALIAFGAAAKRTHAHVRGV